jgi:hypothetical protein
MKRSPQYFTRDGRELKEHEALDHRGIIRSGVVMRTRLMMIDGDSVQRAIARSRNAAHLTDAAGNTGSAMHRPGFRCLLQDDVGERAKEEAHIEYDRMIRDAYKAPNRIKHFGPKGAFVGYSEEESDKSRRQREGDDTETETSDARQLAYDAYEADLTTSYLNPPDIPGAGSHGPPIGQREGDVCMTNNGIAGHLQRGEDGFVCVPDRNTAKLGGRVDAADVQRAMQDHAVAMDKLYAVRDSELAQAWRGGK